MKIRSFRFAVMALVVSLALVAVSFTFTFGRTADATDVAAAPTVTVAPVVQRSVVEWHDVSGQLAAVEHVAIRSRVAGSIEKIHFREGQMVQQGSALFTIDARPYRAQVARAAAARAGAMAKKTLAATELARSQKLIGQRAIAQRELDQNQHAMLEADAALQAADAALLAARLDLAYTVIKSPVSGRVSRAEITRGNLVGSGVDAPVLTRVLSVSPMYVNFEVDAKTYAGYASAGGANTITVAIGLNSESVYPRVAKLQAFDNQIDSRSGTIRARAVLDNVDGALVPGMYAKVRIGGAAAPTLLIDDTAVGSDQDKKYVMVVGVDKRAVYRRIELGPMVDGLRVVRSGLSANEQIVVSGLQRIRPNDLVTPVLASEHAAASTAG